MSRLLKNWWYLFVSNIVSNGVSFFTFIILARKLTPDGYGQFNTLVAAVTLFVTFANNIVAGTVVNREIVSQPEAGRDLARKAFCLRFLGFILASAALVIYQYLNHNQDWFILLSLLALLLANVIWEFCEQISFGYFITKITTYIRIPVSVAWFLIVIALPGSYTVMKMVLILYSAIQLLGSLCYWAVVARILNKNQAQSNISIKQLFAMSLSYLWMRIIGTVNEQVPILLLNGYSGAAQVAYYSVGAKFILPITLTMSAVTSAAFPFITRMFKEDRESFIRQITLGFVSVLVIGSTAASLLTATSPYWMVWIMGGQYASSVEAFNYQIWFAVCQAFDLIISMILSAAYKQKLLAILTTVDIAIYFVFLIFALPFGAAGVAMANLVTRALGAVYHSYVLAWALKLRFNDSIFYMALAYFGVLILISTIVAGMWTQLALITIAMAGFSFIKNSPILEVKSFILNYYKSRSQG